MTDLSKLSDTDLAAIAAGDMGKVSDEGLTHLSGGGGEPAPAHRGLLSYAAGALDELGGGVRTGIAHAASNIPGLENVHHEGDWNKALHGQAPSSSELLDRAGVGEGAKLSDLLGGYAEPGQGGLLRPEKGGMLDPSARGAAGLGLDIATDPLTYLTAGGSALGKFGKGEKVASAVLHPVETALEAGGKKTYKSGLKAVDQEAAKFGKDPVSDLLFENRVKGTNRQIADQSVDLARKVGGERDALQAAADAKGAKVDFGGIFNPSVNSEGRNASGIQGLIEKMKADPAQREAAEALEAKLAEYQGLGPKTVSEAQNLKSSLYKLIGTPAYEEGKATPFYKGGLQDVAGDIKRGIENSANSAEHGLGDAIESKNSQWGQLLSTSKKMDKEAIKGENKNYITSVDGIIAGLSHADPTLLAAKKGADLLKTSWLRTHAGMLMHDISQAGLSPDAIQRLLVNSQKSPWTNLHEQENQK